MNTVFIRPSQNRDQAFNAGKKNVCMHAFNWAWFWYWYHPTECECLPSSLYVCTSKRAISIIAVRLAKLLERSPIHTYIHACYTMLNAPHSNRRHDSYRPCDCGSSSSSSSSMEKSWTATPEMIQSMKSARCESKLYSINTVRWMLVNLRVCVTSYGDWNLQWTV